MIVLGSVMLLTCIMAIRLGADQMAGCEEMKILRWSRNVLMLWIVQLARSSPAH